MITMDAPLYLDDFEIEWDDINHKLTIFIDRRVLKHPASHKALGERIVEMMTQYEDLARVEVIPRTTKDRR
jgi:hypothetical protein